MHEGSIKWYDGDRGFGLIAPDKGDKDVIFKTAALAGFSKAPVAGDRVHYELNDPRRGTEASVVRPG